MRVEVGGGTKINAVRKCASIKVFQVKYVNEWDCFDKEERRNERQKRGGEKKT